MLFIRNKKIFIIVLVISILYGCQTAKVTTALNQKDSGKINEALETINNAIDPSNEKSEKTKVWPRTWEVRGEIYQAIYQSEEENIKKLSDNPLTEAFNSYKKALELDEKEKFSKSIKIKLTLLTNDLTNQAVEAFNAENYEKALNSFEKIIEINDIDIIKADNLNSIDTVIIYNAGLAAFNSGEYDKAIKYYGQAAKYGYEGAKMYSLMANAYQMKGDTLGALDCLKQGFEKYPDDNTVLTNMIQIYLDLNKTNEAMKYLDLAIKQDPDNAKFYFAKGTLLEKLEQEKDAVESYKKAIAIDNNSFNANYNLGALYYNKGVEQTEIAINVPPSQKEKYQRELSKADKWFEMAVPYMEKCFELQPDDRMTLESLKNLYYRLKQMEKYNDILEKLKQ